jgi:hypothetical protein
MLKNITPDKLTLYVVLTTAILTSTTSLLAKMAKRELPEKLKKLFGNTTCRVLEFVTRRLSYG